MCNFRKYLNDLKNSINGVSKSINDKNITIPLETERKENILSEFSHLFPILSLISFGICSFSVFEYLSSIQSSEYYIFSINLEFLTSILTIVIVFSGVFSLYLVSPSIFLFDKKDLTKKELIQFFLGIVIASVIFLVALVLFSIFREKLSISAEICLILSFILSFFVSWFILKFCIKIQSFRAISLSYFILVINFFFLLFFSSFHRELSWDEFIDEIVSNRMYFLVVFIIFGIVNVAFLFFINLNKLLNKIISIVLLFFIVSMVINTMYNKYFFIKLGFLDKDNIPYIIDKDFWGENNLKQKEKASFISVLQDGKEKIFYIYCGKVVWKVGDHYLFQNLDEKIYPIPKNRIRKYLGEDIICPTSEKRKSAEENGS